MEEERFQVLADAPTGSGMGEHRFGDVRGFVVIDFDDLDDAKRFCSDMLDRFGHLRVVVDRFIYDGRTIRVVHEVTTKS